MKIGRFFKDIFTVSIGNVFYLFSSVLLGFALPMVLSIEDFGYYKLYTLYFSYSGFLHFGFIDGILLLFAGKKYEELDKEAFRLYSRFFIYIELLASVIICIISVFILEEIYRTIFIFIAINMVCNNVTLYYQYVSQAVKRFAEFSKRKIIVAFAWMFIIAFLFVYSKVTGHEASVVMCLLMLTGIYILLLVKYINTYKDITWGKRALLKNEKGTLIKLFKTGIVLTVAYEVSRLALLVDQQFVSMLFPVETYAQYAFAYNILSAITAIISSLSIVLLPSLKSMKEEDAVSFFSTTIGVVSTIIAFCMIGYYPIRYIVAFILPEYVHSLVYFQIVFPSLIMTGCISIVMFTFYNALNKTKSFLYIGLGALALSVVCDFFAYKIWGTPEAIAFVRAATTAVWYLMNFLYFAKVYKTKWVKLYVYSIAMIISFYFSTFYISNEFFSALIYAGIFLAMTIFCFKKDIFDLLGKKKEESV